MKVQLRSCRPKQKVFAITAREILAIRAAAPPAVAIVTAAGVVIIMAATTVAAEGWKAVVRPVHWEAVI